MLHAQYAAWMLTAPHRLLLARMNVRRAGRIYCELYYINFNLAAFIVDDFRSCELVHG